MPKTDGFELLSWLRKQRDFDALTVVVMSSSDHPEDVARAEKLGADHYLLKFPSPDRIAEVIAAAAGRPIPRRKHVRDPIGTNAGGNRAKSNLSVQAECAQG